MTLIACTRNFGHPIILGDMLTSSKVYKDNINLPTNKILIDKTLALNRNYPIKLTQKLYIINEKMCIGCAGKVSEIIKFLSAFKAKFQNAVNITNAEVSDFKDQYNLDVNFSNSGLFILLITSDKDKNNFANFIYYPIEKWEIIETENFDKVFACGSGRPAFLAQVQGNEAVKYSGNKGDVGSALSINISFLAKLFMFEKVGLYTIIKNWGGCFEGIYFDGTSLQKLNDIAYVLSETSIDEKGNVTIIPVLVIHCKYYHDLLLISTIDINKIESSQSEGKSIFATNNIGSTLFVVPPKFIKESDVTKEDLPKDFSFKTSLVAFSYSITKNGEPTVSSNFDSSGNSYIYFKNGEGIEIGMQNDIVDFTENEVKNAQ